MPQGGLKRAGKSPLVTKNTKITKKAKGPKAKKTLKDKDLAKKAINKNIEREMIAKAEGDISGSMRVLKADGSVADRKHRKELQKQVVDLQRKAGKTERKNY